MLREVAGDQPLGRAFLKQMKSPLLLFLPRTAPTQSRGSSIMPGAVVACCQHGWVSDDGRQQVVLSGASRGSPAQLGTASLPLQSYYLGVGDAAGPALAFRGFGWDQLPSPVFELTGRGISRGTWVMYLKLSKGFRYTVHSSECTNLSLQPRKALKITLHPCGQSHTGLGPQRISRIHSPSKLKRGFPQSVKLLALSCVIKTGFFLLLQALRTVPETSLPPMVLLSLQVSLTNIHTTWTASSPS